MKQSLFQTFWQVAVDLMADILRYVTQGLSCLLASLFLLCSLSLHAEAPLHPPEQAFQFSVERNLTLITKTIEQEIAKLDSKIAFGNFLP